MGWFVDLWAVERVRVMRRRVVVVVSTMRNAEEDASAILFSSATLAWIWDGILRVRISEGRRHLKSESSSVSVYQQPFP